MTKEVKVDIGVMTVSPTSGHGKTEQVHAKKQKTQKTKLDHSITTYTKINKMD